MICQHLLTHSFCPNRLWDKKVEISSLHPGWKKCFNPLGCSFHSFPFLRKLPEQTLESLLLTKQMFWSSGGGNGEHWISSLTPDAQFLIKLSNLSLRALARESPCSKAGNWTAPRFRRSRFTRTVLEIYSFFPSPVQDHQAREFGCSWILWEKSMFWTCLFLQSRLNGLGRIVFSLIFIQPFFPSLPRSSPLVRPDHLRPSALIVFLEISVELIPGANESQSDLGKPIEE